MRPVRSIADNQWFAKLTRHCVASSAFLDVTGGSAPRRRVEDSGRIIGSRKNRRFYVVPGERIELPTNGLQNRCSTAELTRQLADLLALLEVWLPPNGVVATILLPICFPFV
jgi:hypothetical protein